MIRVLRPTESEKLDGYRQVINVTTRGKSAFRRLSPMLLGPVYVDGKFYAANVENAWQFSKVYPQHVDMLADHRKEPTPEWFEWSEQGRNDSWAHRYPMGKGAKPLASWWNGSYRGYISARHSIYVPMYENTVRQQEPVLLNNLVTRARQCDELIIQDFDAYDHHGEGMTLDDVLNNPDRKMGHGFVLAMMIEEEIRNG